MKAKTHLNCKEVFGDNIKNIRKQIGISQEELATRSGLHRTYISDIERGIKNLSLENIIKLSKALQVNVSDLFFNIK